MDKIQCSELPSDDEIMKSRRCQGKLMFSTTACGQSILGIGYAFAMVIMVRLLSTVDTKTRILPLLPPTAAVHRGRDTYSRLKVECFQH